MAEEIATMDWTEQESDLVLVKLGLNEGDKFRSFEELQAKLLETAKTNFVKFSKRDSRTIEAARKKIKRHIRPELEFYQLRYSCFFSQKNRPRGTGKRNRKSLAREVEVSCPASISIRATEDGEFLEIYNITELHNHPVNSSEYKRITPKTRTNMESFDVITEELGDEEKYKMVLTKCRHIARIASVSNAAQIHEILKNLDDYIFYLKYTTPKDKLNRLDDIKVESNNNLDEINNESIQIIVESDNGLQN